VREIQLTQGKVALVDDEDFEEISKHKWYAKKIGNTFYAMRWSTKFERENGYSTHVLMHRQILGITGKPGDTDHISGDGLDNQKKNLRIVTIRQNGQNRHEKTSSIFPGVCWNKSSSKWQANINIDGRKKHLGLFINEYDAFLSYKKAVNTLGEIMVNEIKKEVYVA